MQGTLACVPHNWELGEGDTGPEGAEQGCHLSIPSTSQLVPGNVSQDNSDFWHGCDFISTGPGAPALGGLETPNHGAWSKLPCPGWGERVQGWAMPSILSPRDPWVPLNALGPEWLPDGVLEPPGSGLRADSCAQLVPGGIIDVSSAWVSRGAEE